MGTERIGSAEIDNGGRIAALDRFRGLAIALMIAFGAAIMFVDTDYFIRFSSHDVTKSFRLIEGYGFYDAIAPLFVFASGLSFCVSRAASVKKIGRVAATKRGLRHGLEVIGIGGLLFFDFSTPLGIAFFALAMLTLALFVTTFFWKSGSARLRRALRIFLTGFGAAILILNVVETALYAAIDHVYVTHWGPLCSIGCGMLICLAVAEKSPGTRIAFAYLFVLLLGCLHVVLPERLFCDFTHGGILGAVGYALLFVLADVAMSLRKTRLLQIAFVTPIYLCAGLSAAAEACSKASVNLPYVLVSFVIAFSLYTVFEASEGVKARYPVLTVLGKNALTAYCLHFAMSFTYGICLNALVAYLPIEGAIPIVLYAAGMVLYVYLMSFVLRALDRKKWIIKL